MTQINGDAVRKAAFGLAAEEGFDGVTMQALARTLHVKAPSLYSHVESLADVKVSVAIRALDLLNEAITRAAVGVSGIDAGYAVGMAYRNWALQNPNLYRSIMVAPSLGCRYEHLIAANKRVGMTVRSALGSFCKTYGDALDAERYLRSLVNGFVSFELAGFFAETVRTTDDSFEVALRRALSAYERRGGEEG